MQAVYSFTAASAGILSLTGTTVHMFDVYRKAGANWIKLQRAGQDVSIGHSQPEVSITLPGEYIVVPDGNRQICSNAVSFAFYPHMADVRVSLQVLTTFNSGYALTPVVNGVEQPDGAMPLLVEYDTEGQVVLLSLPIDGIPNL